MSACERKGNGEGEMTAKGKIEEKNEKVQKDLLNTLCKHSKFKSLTDLLKHFCTYYAPATVFQGLLTEQ